MNRQIEFRVWRKDLDGVNRMMFPGDKNLKEIYFDGRPWNESREGKITQFIGLFDVKGKKIFEGDILKYVDLVPPERQDVNVFCHQKKPKEIGYADVTFGPFGATIMKNSLLVKLTDHLVGMCATSFEIVGNIFENPELIEQTKC